MLIKMQLSLPTESRFVGIMRNVASCVMGDIGAPVEATEDVQVAVTEACANAVRHSQVNEYVVRLEVQDTSCEIEVIDLGAGFDHTEVRAPVRDDIEGGRGLYLMEALVDDVQFEQEDDGTHVRLTKRWTNAPEPVG